MDLENCRCSNRRKNTKPFYFQFQSQKVMLITSAPSFQAVYRQLSSIRFFRNVYLALLGPYPDLKKDSLVSFFRKKSIGLTTINATFPTKDTRTHQTYAGRDILIMNWLIIHLN